MWTLACAHEIHHLVALIIAPTCALQRRLATTSSLPASSKGKSLKRFKTKAEIELKTFQNLLRRTIHWAAQTVVIEKPKHCFIQQN
jgi:hypothetical protein